MNALILVTLGLVVAMSGALVTTWFVVLFAGAALQTVGIDGPGWATVFWSVLALRTAVAGVTVTSTN